MPRLRGSSPSVGLIAENPAKGLSVRRSDRRLDPARPSRPRRAVPLDELYAFFDVMEARFADSLCLAWAPLVSGMRPGELFAADRREVTRESETVFVHETASKKGSIDVGTKTTHHVRRKEQRGRHAVSRRVAAAHGGPADAPKSPPVHIATRQGLEPRQLPIKGLAACDALGRGGLHSL